MAENRESFQQEDPEELVPQVITEAFFNKVQSKTEAVVRDLREQGHLQLARDFNYLFTVAENLQLNLQDEQEKVQKLVDEQVDADGRIEEALKISQKDQDTIKKLRHDVEEAWKISDASDKREIAMSEKLEQMRKNYERTREELKKFSLKFDESEMGPLGKHKDSIIHECERLTEEVRELNERLQVHRAYSDAIQNKLDENEKKFRDLYRSFDTATNDSYSNKRKVEQLTEQKVELEENLEKVTDAMTHYKEQGEKHLARLKQRDSQLEEMTETLENIRNDNAGLKSLKLKLETNIKACVTQSNDMKHDVSRLKSSMRLKEDQNRKLVIEHDRNLKQIESYIRKVAAVEGMLSKTGQEIVLLKTEIVTAQKERDSILKNNDSIKKDNENLNKKVLIQMKEMEKRDETIVDLKKEKLQLEENKNLMNNELKLALDREKKAVQSIKNLKANIEMVESERKYLQESIRELNSEIEEREVTIDKIKMEIEDVKSQLGYFKHEYDTIVKELKNCKADFQRCHEKESDLQDRWMKCKSQNDDINGKLMEKIAEIVNLHKKIKKQDKKYRELNRDFERCRDVLAQAREEMKVTRVENKSFKEALRENDAQFVKMKNQMDKLLRERDLIACQMVRRTDECETLEREVSMLKLTIERGNSMYNERLNDIVLMKNEIRNLRSQRDVLKRALENTADMRHEVFQLHRKLNQERTKTKVLESEMSTPMNVHRWRKLNRFDPKRMELMRKCQQLQRDRLMMSTKMMKAQEVIQALQAKIDLLEKDLIKARLPCAAAQEKLMIARSQLHVNTKRMKAAVAISRTFDPELSSKDHEIAKLQKSLNEMKGEFFKVKQEKFKLETKFRELKKSQESDETIEKTKMIEKFPGKLREFKTNSDSGLSKVQTLRVFPSTEEASNYQLKTKDEAKKLKK